MGVIKGDTRSLDYGSFGNNSIGKSQVCIADRGHPSVCLNLFEEGEGEWL